MTPTWLPAMLDTDGVWEKTLKCLYAVFKKDFITDRCFFNDFPVIWDKRILEGKYEEGFWHLIEKDYHDTEGRKFDPPRAKRLPWCKPIIEHGLAIEIKAWDYRENGRINHYLWLENFDYVVIIQKKRYVIFLVTAYFVTGESSRRNLRKKYERREN
jgi:hypothetical protein